MSQGKKYYETCFLSAEFTRKGGGWFWKRVTNERFLHLLKSSTYHLQWRRTGKVEVQLFYFFKLCARYGWLVKVTSRPLYPLERDPVPIFTGDWVGLETSLDRCGKCFPTGFQTAKPPVRSAIARPRITGSGLEIPLRWVRFWNPQTLVSSPYRRASTWNKEAKAWCCNFASIDYYYYGSIMPQLRGT
jgi:hypothetical protein